MRKQSIYPKTTRISDNDKYMVTEKLDGSNLTFYKLNDELYIAQRNWIFSLSELEEQKDKFYKGLYGWLTVYGNDLQETMRESSAIVGEWIGMGKIKYGEFLAERFQMFAKANVDNNHTIYNLQYDHSMFIYPFLDCEKPEYVGTVPLVESLSNKPTIKYLDERYEKYVSEEQRNVEGFIITDGREVLKYVRFKNGKMEDHFVRGEGKQQ